MFDVDGDTIAEPQDAFAWFPGVGWGVIVNTVNVPDHLLQDGPFA